MINSIDNEKACDKIQHAFLVQFKKRNGLMEVP